MAAAGAHRYWRLSNLYATPSTNWVQIAEVIFTGAEQPGVALSATASASTQDSSNVAANVGDNNTATVWKSNGAGPQWISFDLGQAKAVTEIKIYGPNNTDCVAVANVDYSDNGSTWTNVITGASISAKATWATLTIEQGPPNPNAPVTTKLYPNGVNNVGSFSNAANLVGSSQTAATNTLSLEAVASVYTEPLLNFSTIPAGAVISTVVAKVKAKTSASNTRRLANVLADAYYTTGGGSSKAFDLGSVQLTTTETTYSKSLTWAELTATIPEAKLRDANMVFGIDVWGNGSTTTTATTTISGFWLEVTYTLPSSGVNALFLGEMF